MEKEYRLKVCIGCSQFEDKCEGSNQEDCERRERNLRIQNYLAPDLRGRWEGG